MVVVAEIVAMGMLVTLTMDEIEATEIGSAMTMAATDLRGAWPVRH